ncbi:hypothetical protein MTR64_16890 [Novosphingobium sp. 2580]|uniref:Secreted protein n=2 Tax=Novosphingobium album (ex Hu et al. 2023) TaxID=2930093 RepID=A0ABT0B5E1_9SPHN|nr:hypothetical protein [Novosphingobium album (ex Hu et al. 2023)]
MSVVLAVVVSCALAFEEEAVAIAIARQAHETCAKQYPCFNVPSPNLFFSPFDASIRLRSACIHVLQGQAATNSDQHDRRNVSAGQSSMQYGIT